MSKYRLINRWLLFPQTAPDAIVDVPEEYVESGLSRGLIEPVESETPVEDKGPTVKELKEKLDSLGITYGQNVRKAELQALLDASVKT